MGIAANWIEEEEEEVAGATESKTREGREGARPSIELALIPLCQDPMVSDMRGSRRRRDFGRNHR